jgi:hypothetical protein
MVNAEAEGQASFDVTGLCKMYNSVKMTLQ